MKHPEPTRLTKSTLVGEPTPADPLDDGHAISSARSARSAPAEPTRSIDRNELAAPSIPGLPSFDEVAAPNVDDQAGSAAGRLPSQSFGTGTSRNRGPDDATGFSGGLFGTGATGSIPKPPPSTNADATSVLTAARLTGPVSAEARRRAARAIADAEAARATRTRRFAAAGCAALVLTAAASFGLTQLRDDRTTVAEVGQSAEQLVAGSPVTLPEDGAAPNGAGQAGGEGLTVPASDLTIETSGPATGQAATEDASQTPDPTSSTASSAASATDASTTASSAVGSSISPATTGAATTRKPSSTAGTTASGGASTTARTTGSTATATSARDRTPGTPAAGTRPTTTTTRPAVSPSARPSTTRPQETTTRATVTTTARPSTSRSTTTTTRPSTVITPTTARATTATTATSTTTTTVPATTTTVATTTTTRATTTATSGGSSGEVIWQDDFNSLNTSTWRLEHSTYGDGNNELQCYRPENVSVANGKLVLKAVTESYTCPNGSTRSVTSGMIRSSGVTFSPGQAIEFRVKLTPADPNDQGGLWPAVWASGWAGGWPSGGEMDWLEVMTAENPRRAMFSVHYAESDGGHGLQNKGIVGSGNFSDSWHVVRFDYGLNGRMTWYLDGVKSFEVSAADTLQGFPAPFDQSVREIKINLALGGRPGPLSDGAVGTAGATFEVDYIRILNL